MSRDQVVLAEHPLIVGKVAWPGSRDRLVVRTLRCGRNNPGSNPGHGTGNFFNTLYIKINLFLKHFLNF